MKLSWFLGLAILSQQVNMSDQLLITNHGKPFKVVNRSDFSMNIPGSPFIHPEKFNKFMDKIDQQVSKEPKNAIIDQSGNIIPEQVGYTLDRKNFTEQVYSNFFNKGSSKIEVPLQKIYPRVDSEVLGTIRSEKIGQYVTTFNHYNKERNKNIYLAAESINNFVLFPGEVFSFNKVVGKRTAEKGYRTATVIIKGEFSEDIGGGICQVSTTLFNAVDNAGLNIIKRSSHSKEVSYVPPGRDATVSWNGPDLIFKNNYNQPILIQAKTREDKLIVDVYSSDVITYRPKKVPALPKDRNYMPK